MFSLKHRKTIALIAEVSSKLISKVIKMQNRFFFITESFFIRKIFILA